MARILIILIFVCMGFSKVQAQNDPVLAGMIYMYTEKAEKELKNQEKVMLMQTTGHIWTKEEVKAQIYGFYHEIDRLIDNMGGFTKQLEAHPSNALAVALSTKRNKIYRELILNSVEIVNDIRHVCLTGNKMTEKERVEIVFDIRPKLKVMNKKLQRLTIAVKYTSMGDIWAEIDGGSNKDRANKEQIVKDCMARWKRSGKR